MNEFKEEILFFKYKDTPVTAETLKKDCKRLGVNYTDLNVKISKYQVKKYGQSLQPTAYTDFTCGNRLKNEKRRRRQKRARTIAKKHN